MTEQYKEKFIAYLDILGYSKLVETSENGSGLPPEELLKLAAMLGAPDAKMRFAEHGHSLCPYSRALTKDIEF